MGNPLAGNVQSEASSASNATLRNPAYGSMKKGFPAFPAIMLALFTIAAATIGWINFQKEQQSAHPYDGVWWVEQDGWLRARQVPKGGPADQGGIKPGDKLNA